MEHIKPTGDEVLDIVNEMVLDKSPAHRIRIAQHFAENLGQLIMLPVPAFECLLDKLEAEGKQHIKEASKEDTNFSPIMQILIDEGMKIHKNTLNILRSFLVIRSQLIAEVKKRGGLKNLPSNME